MTHRTRLTVLLAMLTAGAASAATTPTLAGTTITNQATATFDDPSGSSTPEVSKSNIVTSVVLPKPDYDIVFKGGNPTDGGTQNAVGTTTDVRSGTLSTSASTQFTTAYSVVNLGNVELTVNVARNVNGATGTQTVAYYLDVDNSGTLTTGDTLLTDSNDTGTDVEVTVTASGTAEILQVVTIAAGQNPSLVYGASPEGYVYGTGATVSGNGYTSGATVYENNATSNTTPSDLQFTRVELFSVDNTPNPPSTPTNPKTPGGGTYTPPSQGNVDVPTLPGGSPDPTIETPPVTPVTGYTDGGKTPIVPNLLGDEQIAYPKADSDNNDDVVTFTNVVSNTGSGANRVQLYPVAAVDPSTGTLLSGWSFDASTATFTQEDSSGNLILKVQFLSPDGTTAIAVASGASYPSFTVDKNSSVYYQTKITYPDTNDTDLTSPVSVTVGVDSREDGSFAQVSSTKDTIYPAAAQFGDDSGSLTDHKAVNATPVQTVTNYGNFASGSGITTSPDNSDGTAVFPMDVVNNGQYNDTFKLSAKVLSGTTDQGWTVKYYDASGAELAKNSAGEYVTPVVTAGTEIRVYAVINVPQKTATGDYIVEQTGTGYYSTIVRTDSNDVIRVAKPGTLAIAKFVYDGGTGTATFNGLTSSTGYTLSDSTAPTLAKPGETLKYQIIAKNTYPMAISGLVFSDQINTNLTLSRFELSTTASTTTGQLIYSTDGSTWNVYTGAVTTFSGTLLKWAYDSDTSDNVVAPGALPSDAVVTAVITTSIK